MPTRKPKPTSPGRRFSTYADFAEITKTKPEKSLVEGLTKSGGRNARGRKTSRHRGGGAKRLYRRIDFKRTKDGIPAKVAAIEYDPNRTAYIALLHYADGAKAYILAPSRLAVGTTVQSGVGSEIAIGNCLPLRNMPVGTVVHNVELQPGARRPAGAVGRLGRAADGQGGRHGHPAPALGRDAPGPRGLPRDRGHDRQRRSPERQDQRQGRPQAPHGHPPADARRGHEPGRPPARRRRGLHDGWSPSGDPVGRADAGLPHSQEEQGVSDRYIVRGRRRGKGKR